MEPSFPAENEEQNKATRTPLHPEKDNGQGTVNREKVHWPKIHRPEESQMGTEFCYVPLNWYAAVSNNSPLQGSALRKSYRSSTQTTVVPEDCGGTGGKPELAGTKGSTSVFCFCC